MCLTDLWSMTLALINDAYVYQSCEIMRTQICEIMRTHSKYVGGKMRKTGGMQGNEMTYNSKYKLNPYEVQQLLDTLQML